MLIPVFTTWNVKIFEKCPKCNQPLTIKYSDDGMPFIACDNCSYKKELILFKKCPKCGNQMKYIHKYNKFKCEGCNTWFKVKLEESDTPNSKIFQILEILLNRENFKEVNMAEYLKDSIVHLPDSNSQVEIRNIWKEIFSESLQKEIIDHILNSEQFEKGIEKKITEYVTKKLREQISIQVIDDIVNALKTYKTL